MRIRIARSRLAVVTALVAVSMLGGLVSATTSGATGSSFPWTDPNAAGSLIFYNASGQVITGGSFSGTNDTLAAYVEGTYDPANTDNKATLFAFTPVQNIAPGAWNGESLGSSTRYPVTGASVPSNISSLTLPVETGSSTSDTSLGQYISTFPNSDSSTTDGYADLYVIRLVTSGPAPAGADATYDDAVIEVNSNGAGQGTWNVVTSDPWTSGSTTNVTLGLSNPGSVSVGTSETLTATVSPAATGTVQFFSGTTSQGSAPVVSGVATLTTSAIPVGNDTLTASFTPTGSSTPSVGSTAVSLVVNAAPTKQSTKTTLKVGSKKIVKGAPDKLTAIVSPAAAGKVAFYQGSKKVATVGVVRGSASVTIKTLAVGTDVIKAVFTSSNAARYSNSTSGSVKVVVKK